MRTLAVCVHCSEPHVRTMPVRRHLVYSERSTMGQPACTLWQYVRIAVSRTMRVSPPPLC